MCRFSLSKKCKCVIVLVCLITFIICSAFVCFRSSGTAKRDEYAELVSVATSLGWSMGRSAGDFMGWRPHLFLDKRIVLLCRVVDAKNVVKIDEFVLHKVDVNYEGRYSMTPLIWSYLFAYFEGINDGKYYFYNFDVSREAGEKQYDETFTQMCLDDRVRCIERLLYHGADPNTVLSTDLPNTCMILQMGKGTTAVHLAAMQLDPQRGLRFNCLPLMLKYGGNINLVDGSGQTPIFMACKSHDNSMGGPLICSYAFPFNVGLLIDAGADIEHRDTQGNTPLVVAAAGENYDVVLMLLEAGAKDEGKSVVKYLRKSKQKNPHISTQESIDPYYNKVVDFLKAKGALSDADIDVLTAPPPDNVKPFVDPIPGARRPFDPYADEWIQKRKGKLKNE